MAWPRSPVVLASALAFLITTPLLLVGTAGHAIQNGDEAIYAEMAREMVESGHWGELRWQGERLFPRPPGQVWLLAAAQSIAGDTRDERAVRWTLAATCGLEVALVVALGASLFGLGAGLIAGGTLLTCDLFIGYGRYLESEPLLCVLVIAALLAWERASARSRWLWVWGALAGAALMTKQIVGAVAFLPALLDESGAPRWNRQAWRGGVAAGLVLLPWHLWALVRFGRPFLTSYLVGNVIQRGAAALHSATHWTFYAKELWRSEGVFALVLASAAVSALAVGLLRRRRPELLVGVWALGVFAVYSLARTRFDYYLLLAYPALALATGALLARLPVRPSLRLAAVVAFLVAAGAAHLGRDLAGFSGDDEVRALARVAEERLRPPARLYAYNTHVYSARFYSSLAVATLAESEADYREAQSLARFGLPAPVELAQNLAVDLAGRRRPFALLLPRARAELVHGVSLRPVAATAHFLLYEGR